MKKTETLKKIMYGLFVTVLVILGLYIAVGEWQTDSQVQMKNRYCRVFDTQWEQVLPDGSRREVSLPGKLTSEDHMNVEVVGTLPDRIDEDAYLVFRSGKQNMTVWVGDELRQRYDAGEIIRLGDISPVYSVFVKINPSDAGKSIRVHSFSRADTYGTFNRIYYANESGYWYEMYRQSGTTFLVGLVMLIVGATTLVFSLIIRVIYKQAFKTMDLSITVILVSLWLLSNSVFRQLFFHNVSVVGDIAYAMVMLLPIPVGRYVNQLQGGRYEKWYLIVEGFALADTFFCFAMQYLDILYFHQTFYVMISVMGVLMLLVVGTMLLDLFTGRIKSYGMAAAGVLLFLSMGIAQIINYLRYSSTFDIGFAGVALLLMLLVATMETVSGLMEIQKERQEALTTSKMKSRFLANMSHEIRTPMNAILGLNEIILQESEEPRIQQYARDVDRSGKMLLGIINDILDYSQIESGKMVLKEVPYNLKELLDELLITTSVAIRDKKLQLKVLVDENLPVEPIGDGMRIRQVLLNLLTNATKYTNEGGITVRMHGEAYTDKNFNLVVAVEDTGIGMKQEDMAMLFESFQRLDLHKNRTIEGTGLGLAITKNLLEQMNGTIEVTSEYGKGSVFTITVPQGIAVKECIGDYQQPAEREKGDEMPEKEETGKVQFPGNRILAVDDVKMNLMVLKGLLKDSGLEIDTALSGAEALEKWEKHSYSLVFMDDMMPEMDGVSCMHRMKAVRQDIPIVVLTANVVDGAKERYLQEGFREYLSKPVKQKELYDILQKYLQ